MTRRALAPWYRQSRPQWEAAVSGWLTATGQRLGLGQVEAVSTVKERPWSVVRQVIFTHGSTYFKACGAGGSFEPGLLLFLEQQGIPFIPKVLATGPSQKSESGQITDFSSPGNDWLLLADAGVPVREGLPAAEQVPVMAPVLARYAELQLASLQWVERLQEIGLSDRRVERLPGLLPSLLADRMLGTAQPSGAIGDLRAAVLAQLPHLKRVCTRLADSPYAAALDHGDLHWGNLLVGEGGWRLLDWGDASLTHPFCSVVITFETVRDSLPSQEREKWVIYLRDAYLEPWVAHYPRAALLSDFHRALWVGQLVRALNYAHMFQGAPEEVLNRWRPMIFERLGGWARSDPGD